MHDIWDLGGLFPQFAGPEHQDHLRRLEAGLARLESLALELGHIRTDNVADWAALLVLDEELMALFSHLSCYTGCQAAADVRDERYKAALANLSTLGARFTAAFAPVLKALREVDDAAFAALLDRPELDGARYTLERLRREAGWSLETGEEILAAELGVDGIQAWGRLYDELAGRLTFSMPAKLLGRTEQGEVQVPMAQKRSLLEDSDPVVRQEALTRSNAAWEQVAPVTAAALNAISGTRLTLYKHRGLGDYLEKPFFDAAVRRESVEAMWTAVASAQDTAERIMRLKARCLGQERLGFADLYCPIPQATGARYTWEQAVSLVLEAFDAGYPALGAFAREMLEGRRVEAQKREAKRPGAFCSSSLLARESYVFMSFGGGLGDVQTLAHELGHAYHTRCLRPMRVFAARYPMTLAETASTFAERLLQDAILASPRSDDGTRLAVLTARCNDAVTFLCDIRMRYEFERAFYERRRQGEVALSCIAELLLEAQRRCFGGGLDPERLDPLFWASKLHFYITGVSFYNFPYTFGFLFSLSLAAQLQERGAVFLADYEALLRLTGSAGCEEAVAQTLGQDITKPAFWHQALERITADAAQFEALLARQGL